MNENEKAFLAEKASMSLASGSWGRRRRWRGRVSPSTLGCSRDRWNFRKCCSHFLAAAPCHCGWWRHSKSWPSLHLYLEPCQQPLRFDGCLGCLGAHRGGPVVGQPPPRGRRGKSQNRELAPPTNAPGQMHLNRLCKVIGHLVGTIL